MLGLFSSDIMSPPEELVAAANRSPSEKISAKALLNRFMECNTTRPVFIQTSDHVHLAYTRDNESPLLHRSFGAKDDVFCLFEGRLDNLGKLKQEYGLFKSADEAVLVIEAYKALRDRAPYPASHLLCQLVGHFAFVLFDNSTSTLFVASDQFDRVSLYWGITDDRFVAFSDDAKLLKGACGKSVASFPNGCFFLTSIGELRSYENPKRKIIAVPAAEEEMWGATFKVEGSSVLAASK